MNDIDILVINHRNGLSYKSVNDLAIPKNFIFYCEPNIIFQDGLFTDNSSYEKYNIFLTRLLSLNEYKYPDIDDEDNFKYDEIINITSWRYKEQQEPVFYS